MDVQRVGMVHFAGKRIPATFTKGEKLDELRAILESTNKSIAKLQAELQSAISNGDRGLIKNLEARISQMQEVARDYNMKLRNAQEGLDIKEASHSMPSTYIPIHIDSVSRRIYAINKQIETGNYSDKLLETRDNVINQHLLSSPKSRLANLYN